MKTPLCSISLMIKRSFVQFFVLVCFFLAVLAAAPCLAQTSPNLEQGFKPYGSYQGGNIDSVSLTNGNVILHIPIVSYPQRGGKLRLNFMALYNNKGWTVAHTSSSPPQSFWSYNGGWMQIVPDQPISLTGQEVKSINNDGTWLIHIYQAVTADGSTHLLGPTGSSITCADGIFGAGCIGETVDATGIRYERATQTLIDRDGVRYSSQYISGPISTTTWTDRNGNQIIADQNGWHDTLGRLIPGSVPSDGTYGSFNANQLLVGVPASDLSLCPAGTQSARLWNLPGFNGGTAVMKFCYGDFFYHTNFGLTGITEAQGFARLINAIVLPDAEHTKWQFQYNNYLDLTSVSFPTGGSITYTWATDPLGMRVVTSRTLNANDGSGPHTWNYQWNALNGTGPFNVVTDPAGNDTTNVATQGYITETKSYSGSYNSGTLLKTVDTQYRMDSNPIGDYLQISAPTNVVPQSVTTTWATSGKVSQTATPQYDPGFTYYVYNLDGSVSAYPALYGVPILQTASDYGQGSPGAVLKQTSTAYQWQNNSNYLTANLLNLPASVVEEDGSSNRVAEMDYTYDDPNRLYGSNISTQHVAAPGPVRGNISTVTHWLNNPACNLQVVGSCPTIYTNIYDTGEVYQSTDPLLRTTTFTYDPAFAGAYVTQTQLPDTTSNGATVHHITRGNYDFNTGVLTSLTDQNGNTSTYSYDIMSRITSATGPADPKNGGQQAQTTFIYNDSVSFNSPYVQRQDRTVDSNTLTTSWTQFDGLGRAIRTAKTNGEKDSSGQPITNFVDDVDTCYDSMGRKQYETYPYQGPGWSQGTYHCPPLASTPYDSFIYDALSRLTTTTESDGSAEQTNYLNFPLVMTMDEAGRQRQNITDGLGRLVQVNEPGSSGTPSTPATGSVPINGSLQSTVVMTQAATSAVATVTINGQEQSYTPDCEYIGGKPHCYATLWDTGTVTLTVNGFSSTAYYGMNSTVNTIVADLVAGFQAAGSPVTAVGTNDWTGVISLYASPGAAGNSNSFSYSVTYRTNVFSSPSFYIPLSSPFTGGQDPVFQTVYDSGTVSLTMPGCTVSAPYSISGNNNASLVAGALAEQITPGSSCQATGSAVGNGINLTAKTPGSTISFSVTSSSTWNQTHFAQPSFSSPGGSVGGGSDGNQFANPLVTLYSYDSLGNMLCVEQHGNVSGTGCSSPPSSDASSAWRVRRFTYDSLSRLLTARNPESGTIQYGYDNDSNLTSKISPANNQGSSPTTINYGYDELNRLRTKTFSSGGGATYLYDLSSIWGASIQNGIGRLGVEYNYTVSDTQCQPGVGATCVGFLNSYDVAGRTIYQLQFNQRIPVQVNKPFNYAYNLDGTLKTITYPSTRMVTYNYNAAQRPISAIDNNNVSFASGAHYTAWGALSSLVNGSITTTNYFNARMQPIFLSASAPGQTVLSLGYDFASCYSNGGDNGNVCGVTNNKNTSRSVNFHYDSLNRLLAANSTNWTQNYTYDPWGNLLQKTVTGGDTPLNLIVNGVSTVNGKNQATNWCYDAAGNLVGPNPCPNFTNVYDAENRLIQTTTGVTTSYDYNADGLRVKKTGNASTLYWYGLGGEVLEETDLNGNLTNEYIFFGGKRTARYNSTNGYSFYFSDHLGSADVLTDSLGNIKEESDYYPFGGERVVTDLGIGNNYKFTGKERDPETGCDYFGARYYCNTIGRF
ncbi:MAG TPA: RHS repeat-associated core domain-containing protein, partial [Terriglobales bacterium]|nr:RHS repeat-associated core domain-containing protein [Terriglobales bacterium]